MKYLLLFMLAPLALHRHDAHGRYNAPAEARRLKNPVGRTQATIVSAETNDMMLCANCHDDDGRPRTKTAGAMPTRPTDLSNYLMTSMKEAEIYRVVANGIDQCLPLPPSLKI